MCSLVLPIWYEGEMQGSLMLRSPGVHPNCALEHPYKVKLQPIPTSPPLVPDQLDSYMKRGKNYFHFHVADALWEIPKFQFSEHYEGPVLVRLFLMANVNLSQWGPLS